MRYNIRDLYKANGQVKPFLGDVVTLSHLPFMAEYLGKVNGSDLDAFTSIDRRFARLYASFEPTYNADDIGDATASEVLTEFKADILAMLVANMKKYTQFYELQKAKYDPIENYNMIERGKDETTGTHSEETRLGTQKTTSSLGEQSVTNEYGAVTNTVSVGAVSATDEVGQRTDSTTGKVSGYNESALIDANASEVVSGHQTNTHSEKARTDSTDTNAHTDTSTTSSRADTMTTEQTTPTNTSGTDSNTFNHELTRSGNIGVTTTQQMMEQEVKFWDSFNFYKVIFDDIVKSLCNLNDGGYDTHLTPLMNVIMKGE